MSTILPKDIKKTDFKKTLRGYDANEVDAFLETVCLRYERLYDENISLTEKVKILTSDIDLYKENETTLQKAIVKAQDLAEEILGNAKKRAENIVKESELNAQKILQNTEKEIMGKKQELEELKLRNEKLVEDVKLFFLEKLNEMDEFLKLRNIYKMELAGSHYDTSENDPDNGHDSEAEKNVTMKKISINTANSNFSE